MNIKQFFEAIEYKVTEGNKYMWGCYGPDAWSFESFTLSDGYDQTIPSASMIVDNKTQTVYEVEVFDNKNSRAYRWINPDYVDAFNEEAKRRGVKPDNAYDDVDFIAITVEADILEKVTAIMKGEDYDTRIQIEINIDDDALFFAMKAAHQQDITFNQYITNVLQDFIEKNNEQRG